MVADFIPALEIVKIDISGFESGLRLDYRWNLIFMIMAY
jgi:hypothetical protein